MFNYYVGNEGVNPQSEIENKILQAHRETKQSKISQERLIGLLGAQTLNKSIRRTDNGFSYFIG